ncbi:hypothetical protein CC1G_14167 [Coprinopsis cinerea okayama7|uniref:Uncharacterized protein n=1 Tax=Coprinopsis cinerea (strain Okayama-7 / 130 / ATCC MYA-4618 / FGSC 9003) TaxID=240176 RepID=D6RL68_COPC7|nr:hypothetical protein CC1G_14167 [Coprinopsis cinerea okayama7\|eukprot:XP_002911634.1 hypothetical protein CC1G_14167 [Coprinopsis cinerea okayama7\
MQFKILHTIILSFLTALILSSFVSAISPGQFVQEVLSNRHASLSRYVSTTVAPTLEDVWRKIVEQSQKAFAVSKVLLEEGKKEFKDVSLQIDEFKSHMEEFIEFSRTFRLEIQDALRKEGFTEDGWSDALSREMEKVVEAIMKEFEDPLPEDQDERYRQREKMISFALDEIEKGFIRACALLKIPEPEARAKFAFIRPRLQHYFMIAGNIIERHPQLFKTLVISAVCMLVVEPLIFIPVLRVFGFGVLGPVKGSAAAWLQRKFWRGAVESGSWFAVLQRAGMKLTAGWGWKVIVGIGAGIGVIGGGRGCR